MRRKNVLKLLIMVFAVMLFITACSPAPSAEPEPETTQEEQSPTEEPAVPEEEVANEMSTPEMDFDLGGRTIKVVAWWDMQIPDNNPDNIQRIENLEALKKKHNFEIEYVSIDFGEYQEKVVASLMAGEPLGDIVRLGKDYAIPALTKQDLLWPVDEYIKNDKVFNQKTTKEYMQYEGKGYGFTEDKSSFINGIFYNRTLMQELGLKPLQEYVDTDEWNWDTFIDVAKQANQDRNNDGKLDTWGLAQTGLLEPILYSNEASLTNEDKQNLEDPKTKEALNFLSKLATEKVGRASEGGDWTEPATFFRQGNTLMYAGAMYEVEGIMTDMQDYDIGFLPFPKGPSASAYHSGESRYQALTIPKSVENPEQLMYIWEKINEIDSIYEYPEQSTLETYLIDEADINNARMVAEGMLVLDHNTFPSLPYWDFDAELKEGVSVSTLIEKYKAPFQAAIDEVYK
ncbi:extracellular solute-binding protein [Paenibacillus urinalis]|uniref:Extracellular solute-binding protein n=1 Tax=Paenibacillus urinalis TaxID=521520 RepID=A0AAX3N542_9BACL|nr:MULTISPECIES: extracellular solute-binding protein [Paenibacillus]WDH84866.1 extracellular solute-binding protein [Paenibacillus urinalis]WDH96326.1 extracellular solute-binding protein [Paenibacillus urinalis]WDI04549.1 extracellular solute-binding protein [Paenibacillus urinalis]